MRTRSMRRLRKQKKAAARAMVVCAAAAAASVPPQCCCRAATFKEELGIAASRGCTTCLARLLASPAACAPPLVGYAGSLAAINGQCESLALLLPRICCAEFLRGHSFVVSDMAVLAASAGHLSALVQIADFADEWNRNAVAAGCVDARAGWKDNAQLCTVLATNGRIDCLRFVLSRGHTWPDRAEFASRRDVYCYYSPQAECVRIAASTHRLVYL